jgi:hypothetical protein
MARDTEQQTPTMQAEPQKEHEWLQKLVGDWAFEVEAPSGPGEAPEKFSGTETVRSLGDLWFVAEGQGEMPGGGAANTIMTLGYDPAKQRYVGTWIGSMMTHLWVYEGEVSADENKLTLETEGPDMETAGKLAQYREAIEFKSNDHRVFTSQVLKDGSWQPMMTANYRRKK